MADSETQQPVDRTQQVTSQTPATKQKKSKKVSLRAKLLLRERKGHARRRKKLLSRHRASSQGKNVDPPAEPVADPPQVESTKNVLTTTQWLSVISILVSLAEIYFKRKEIKSLLTKKTSQIQANTPRVDAVPQATKRKVRNAPPPAPVYVVPKKEGIIWMD